MGDDFHVFLIATLVFTRLLLNGILPPYWITIWVIDWWCNVCLFTGWIGTRYLLQRFDIGNRWIWTRINYRLCITSEPTNKVCLSPLKKMHKKLYLPLKRGVIIFFYQGFLQILTIYRMAREGRGPSFMCARLIFCNLCVVVVFFYQGFLSQTLTIHRIAGEGRGTSFIPHFHFHPLTNIETFICNFACEMTITYF